MVQAVLAELVGVTETRYLGSSSSAFLKMRKSLPLSPHDSSYFTQNIFRTWPHAPEEDKFWPNEKDEIRPQGHKKK